MKGNWQGVEQEEVGAAVVVAGLADIGHVLGLQSPQCPFTWLPYLKYFSSEKKIFSLKTLSVFTGQFECCTKAVGRGPWDSPCRSPPKTFLSYLDKYNREILD